jgi:hypothetical protein
MIAEGCHAVLFHRIFIKENKKYSILIKTNRDLDMGKQPDVTLFFELAPEHIAEVPDYGSLSRVEQVAVFRAVYRQLSLIQQEPLLKFETINGNGPQVEKLRDVIGYRLGQKEAEPFVRKAVLELNSQCERECGLDAGEMAEKYTHHVDAGKIKALSEIPPSLTIGNKALLEKLFPASIEVGEKNQQGRTV